MFSGMEEILSIEMSCAVNLVFGGWRRFPKVYVFSLWPFVG